MFRSQQQKKMVVRELYNRYETERVKLLDVLELAAQPGNDTPSRTHRDLLFSLPPYLPMLTERYIAQIAVNIQGYDVTPLQHVKEEYFVIRELGVMCDVNQEPTIVSSAAIAIGEVMQALITRPESQQTDLDLSDYFRGLPVTVDAVLVTAECGFKYPRCQWKLNGRPTPLAALVTM